MHTHSLLSLLPALAALSTITLAKPAATGEAVDSMFFECPADAKQGLIICDEHKYKYGICTGEAGVKAFARRACEVPGICDAEYWSKELQEAGRNSDEC